MRTEPPDTTKAVAETLKIGGVETPTVVASAAVGAHRQALADAGWVEAPKVKLGAIPDEWHSASGDADRRRIYQAGWESAIKYLQSLGLHIELEEP